jgi:hypothetical protein
MGAARGKAWLFLAGPPEPGRGEHGQEVDFTA